MPRSDVIDNESSREDLDNRDGTAIRNDPPLLTPDDSNTQQSAIAQHKATRERSFSAVSNREILSMLGRTNETLEKMQEMFERVMTAQSVLNTRAESIHQASPVDPFSQDRHHGNERNSGDVATNISSSGEGSSEDEDVAESGCPPAPILSRKDASSEVPAPNSSVINQIQPEIFDGNRSKARAWLRHYEETMAVNGYSDSDKLKRARAYLKKEASQWLTTMIRLNSNMDWRFFKTRFLKHFCGLDRMSLRRKLEEAQQGSSKHPSSLLDKQSRRVC